MRRSRLCLVIVLGFLSTPVTSLPCISFDAHWNLYAFGIQGQYDWAFGTQESWSRPTGPTVINLDKTDAPPFNGANTQCLLSQSFNAIYVLDGDKSNPSAVHVFNADNATWSVQKTDTSEGPDLNVIAAVLDHDTNIIFGLSNGQLYQLPMSNINRAQSGKLPWQTVKHPSFTTSGYTPVVAAADSHVFFLNVPGSGTGQANIFDIHFLYFQTFVQSFIPTNNTNAFPTTSGQTTSVWFPTPASQPPTSFAFFPSDGSSTYMIDTAHNTSTSIPYPPASPQSGYSSYAGSLYSLVQLTPSGEIYYTSFNAPPSPNSTPTPTSSVQSVATSWTKLPNPLWTQPTDDQVARRVASGGRSWRMECVRVGVLWFVGLVVSMWVAI